MLLRAAGALVWPLALTWAWVGQQGEERSDFG